MIAAPDGANDLHIQVLARLAQLLMEPLFCEELKQAATPEEFLAVIAKREQGETAREARAEAVAEAALTEPRLAPRVLAVTACPTGIAHTYMAAEALEAEAAEMHIAIKVETNGADGVKNHLTEQEIENAECIIVAADKAWRPPALRANRCFACRFPRRERPGNAAAPRTVRHSSTGTGG